MSDRGVLKMSGELRTIEIEDFLVTPQASKIIDKLWSLKCLGSSACLVFEGDDGPEHCQTCESLLQYLKMFGGKLIRLGGHDVELIHVQNICSGNFVVQLD